MKLKKRENNTNKYILILRKKKENRINFLLIFEFFGEDIYLKMYSHMQLCHFELDQSYSLTYRSILLDFHMPLAIAIDVILYCNAKKYKTRETNQTTNRAHTKKTTASARRIVYNLTCEKKKNIQNARE